MESNAGTILEARSVNGAGTSSGAESSPVRDVSLAVERGILTLLCGCDGSGKNTLLRLLALLDAPNSGEILLRGKPTCGLDCEEPKWRAK